MRNLIIIAISALALAGCVKEIEVEKIVEVETEETERLRALAKRYFEELEALTALYHLETTVLEDEINLLKEVIDDLESEVDDLEDVIYVLQEELDRIELYSDLEYGFPTINSQTGPQPRADAVLTIYYTDIHRGWTGFHDDWFFSLPVNKGGTKCWKINGASIRRNYEIVENSSEKFVYQFNNSHGEIEKVTLNFEDMEFVEEILKGGRRLDIERRDLFVMTNASKCN